MRQGEGGVRQGEGVRAVKFVVKNSGSLRLTFLLTLYRPRSQDNEEGHDLPATSSFGNF